MYIHKVPYMARLIGWSLPRNHSHPEVINRLSDSLSNLYGVVAESMRHY